MNARPPTTADRIVEIRKWISKADAAGTPRSGLVLHLSNRDISGLRRSSDVATDEIRFADGVMHFLDIEVAEAAPGATSSLSERAAG